MASHDRQIERTLTQSGIRYTKGRKALVAALTEADGPLSASGLAGKIGDSVPLSSLYRSLSIFEELGIVTPHFASKGIARYELAEWLQGHHHHLVCVKCGMVEDIEVSTIEELEVQNLVAAIATGSSFTPTNHALEIEGRCVSCA